MNPRKVEEGPVGGADNRPDADAMASLCAYHARKRLLSVRTLIFLAPLVALVTTRNPVAGLQLALGGTVGVLNMLLVMRQSERLLDGRQHRAVHILNSQVRLFAIGILPVAVALRLGQFWTVSLYLGGIFTPLVLYAIEYRRSIRRGN